jgi:hypothetical protein
VSQLCLLLPPPPGPGEELGSVGTVFTRWDDLAIRKPLSPTRIVAQEWVCVHVCALAHPGRGLHSQAVQQGLSTLETPPAGSGGQRDALGSSQAGETAAISSISPVPASPLGLLTWRAPVSDLGGHTVPGMSSQEYPLARTAGLQGTETAWNQPCPSVLCYKEDFQVSKGDDWGSGR